MNHPKSMFQLSGVHRILSVPPRFSEHVGFGVGVRWFTQRLHSSSFLGLPYRILYMSPKKELLWSLRVRFIVEARKLEHGFRRISARIPYTLH